MGARSGSQRTVYIPKTADETVNNSSTLQDDDELVLPVGTNETWFFEAFVLYNSNATADIKFGWSVPDSTTMSWGKGHVGTAVTPGFTALGAGGGPADILSEASVPQFPGSASSDVAILLAGWVFSDATSGSVTLSWAQNTPDVSNTTVKAGSFIRARRLA